MIIVFVLIFLLIVIFCVNNHRDDRDNADVINKVFSNPELISMLVVEVALATIGRKTRSNDEFFTSWRREFRLGIEYPLFSYCHNKYGSTQKYDLFVSRFSYFKEACLFTIFEILLGDKGIYNHIRKALICALCEDLLPSEIPGRIELYTQICSDIGFGGDRLYMFKEMSVEESIFISYWNTLIEDYPKIFLNKEKEDKQFIQFFLDIFVKYCEEIGNICVKSKLIPSKQDVDALINKFFKKG